MTRNDLFAGLSADDRGVSETIGFVLVFALITSTIAVTFTVGLGGLEDAQLAEPDGERHGDGGRLYTSDAADEEGRVGLGGRRLSITDIAKE